MQKINSDSVNSWGEVSSCKFAQSISISCPFCHERGTFTPTLLLEDTDRKTISYSSTCPTCQKTVFFWVITLKDIEPLVYMFPECKGFREILFADSEIPGPLRRAYESTVNAFNSKNYTATAVCCRRTLEGIFKYRLPEGKKDLTLAKAIDQIKDSEDLAKPLNNLSHAIRQGGNLGAHFDMEKEPGKELAEAMVDLLEYFIEYLYTLPSQIERIDNVLGNDSEDVLKESS
jgi:hypothetical protein